MRAAETPAEGSTAQAHEADPEENARQTYQHSLHTGDPLSRNQLGRQFGRSRDWARDRIQEIHAETREGSISTPHEPNETVDRIRQDNSARPAENATIIQPTPAGRSIAWLAFSVGVAASIAANVLHAQIVSSTSAAWIGAAFWPIALLLGVEVLTRIDWPDNSRWYTLAKYGGTGLVATVAAILSYRHMAGLLQAWGEDDISARLGPLAVDGLMVTATAALLAGKPRSRRT